MHQQRGSRRLFNINERFNEVGSVGLYHHSVLRVCGSVCVGEREGERKKERESVRVCEIGWVNYNQGARATGSPVIKSVSPDDSGSIEPKLFK